MTTPQVNISKHQLATVFSIIIAVVSLLAAYGVITPQQATVTQTLIQQLMKDMNLTYVQVSDALTTEVGSSLSSLAQSYSYMISHPLGDTSITAMQNGTTGIWQYWKTNATLIFNSAVANLTAGGNIFVRAGTYNLNGSITATSKENITLTFENGAALFVANGMNASAISLTSCKNWLISGITINGNAANQAPWPTASNGIQIYSSVNVEVEQANIYNVAVFGFYPFGPGTERCGIINSKVTFCGLGAILLGQTMEEKGLYAVNNEAAYNISEAGIDSFGNGSIITGNYVHDINGTTGPSNAEWGIGAEGGTGAKLSENTISNAGKFGVYLSPASRHNIVSDNTILNTTGAAFNSAGICEAGSFFDDIHDNHVGFSNGYGIQILANSMNGTVHDNFVWDAGLAAGGGQVGIAVQGNSTRIHDNTVYDDRAGAARTQLYGILIYAGACNNLILDNYMNNNPTADYTDGGTSNLAHNNWYTGAWHA